MKLNNFSSFTTNNPSIGNTDVVLEEFTAEEQCCCLPISSCPSVSANLMVEVEETFNTSSTTTPSPSRVIFRSGLGAVGGCNEGEVRCCEGCNEVPLLGREISCGREGEGEAELAERGLDWRSLRRRWELLNQTSEAIPNWPDNFKYQQGAACMHWSIDVLPACVRA